MTTLPHAIPDACKNVTLRRSRGRCDAGFRNWSGSQDCRATAARAESRRSNADPRGGASRAHTVSHPILARLTDGQARQEISGSKSFLEQLLGERVGLFAYPNGKPGEDYSPQSVAIVRSLDFDAAVSTAWGTHRAGDDLFQMRRFTPWDHGRLRFGVRMLANLRSA